MSEKNVLAKSLAYYRYTFQESLQLERLNKLAEKINTEKIKTPTLYLHGINDGCIGSDLSEGMESYFNDVVPEDKPYYKHIYEGADDMPAHIKSSLLGNSVTIPISNGKLNLGVWQGIYLCEHRNNANNRQLIITLFGLK